MKGREWSKTICKWSLSEISVNEVCFLFHHRCRLRALCSFSTWSFLSFPNLAHLLSVNVFLHFDVFMLGLLHNSLPSCGTIRMWTEPWGQRFIRFRQWKLHGFSFFLNYHYEAEILIFHYRIPLFTSMHYNMHLVNERELKCSHKIYCWVVQIQNMNMR